MRFSMLYSGEQILSFKSCLVFYAEDSLIYTDLHVRTKMHFLFCHDFSMSIKSIIVVRQIGKSVK